MIHPTPYSTNHKPAVDLLFPLKQWVNNLEVNNAKIAHLLCKVIPCSCPFERKITVMGRTLFQIPPLCKLNPLYQEFVVLRLKALSYLADVCGEDVAHYIC
ncbi:Mo-dependent nitrogenase C-terminal domain-containing protein [Crocosphaera sp. XPORK-15E]|uniref:Mo-dependent nitrogenase C-terminal domain-containing protein n=1 Tax=Crocosphaera sp. XPORK-15E TaxID=3110247 RepID=UPI002B1F8A66|nr:Mo-dependent nitrogenase C-terminal domain-containing protein [Crocosphaera sp. XPORK-15E]MEA5533388.1 Mo-dependent nitrogenase C-terminal domain-containing protein [Crocosphaera sp. XPORK-15E]